MLHGKWRKMMFFCNISQIFLDLINKSMQASVRQVRLSLGRPSSQATREEALQQVAMLKAAKEAQQIGK